MGLFNNKRIQDEYENGHNNDLFTDDDDDITFFKTEHKVLGDHKTVAPHAITADELMGVEPENIPMKSDVVHEAPSVYKRLKEQEQMRAETAIEDDYVPSWAVKPEAKEDTKEKSNGRPDEVKMTSNEKPAFSGSAVESNPSVDEFLARCRMAVDMATGKVEQETVEVKQDLPFEPIQPIETHQFDRFTESDNVRPVGTKATAHSEADMEDIIRRLKGETEVETKPAEDDVVKSAKTETIEETENSPREIKVEVEVIPTDSEERIMSTTESGVESDVRIYGKIVHGEVLQSTPNGDIAADEFIKTPPVKPIEADGATMVFGAELGNILSQKADESFAASKRAGGAYFDEDEDEFYNGDVSEVSYYETEDEDLREVDDYKTLSDSARLRVRYGEDKTKNTTISILSYILLGVAAVISIPVFKSLIGAKAVGTVMLVLLTCLTIINYDVFTDVGNLLKGKPGFNSCVSLALILGLVQCAVDTLCFCGGYASATVAVMLLTSIARSAELIKIKRIKKGLEKIATSEPKHAVITADDDVSEVIASGAVQYEATVATGKNTVNVRNYIKNSLYKSPFELKLLPLFIAGAATAVIAGVLAGYLLGASAGLAMSVLSLCAVYPACSALTAELPLYNIVKKIARFGAMLAGYKGAYELNLTNVVTVNTSDLFPNESIKLYNMKPLSENEVGRSITYAAAVAIAAKSPLAGIFAEMVGDTGEKGLPKVGGVKYEDKMGVSGWIGDNTILIGNRNLMQAHNVAVPALTVDQKILHAGYFPIYIACNGTPCLLFVVKYDVDPNVCAELQRLCNTGMTVVVNPEDPNATDIMICDYFGLPNDAIKVMNHNARVAFETETAFVDSSAASASYGKSVCGLFAAVSGAIGLWKTISAMTALFIVAAVLGVILLVFTAILGKLALGAMLFSVYQLIFIIVGLVISAYKG